MKNITFYDEFITRLGAETVLGFERRAGLTPGVIQNWKSKGMTPSRPSLLKVAEAFGEPYEEWLAVARRTRIREVIPGRHRRNRSYVDRA